MKNVLITGGNGMIGGLILNECLRRPEIKKVTSITRRPLGIKHDKLVEVIHQDFLDYTAIQEHFKDQDLCFYCIGVYTGQVPAKEFNTITIDFTKAFSETLRRNSNNTTFCFLSGDGADQSEKSRILFAKAKGIAENGLLKLNFAKTYIFRPGYIYPVTPRKEPNLMYKIMRVIYKPLSAIAPNIGTTSVKLANKMMEIGLNGGDKIIYENRDIRK
jgi:nucleoside-diphosphate-sugar epimerase